MVTACNGHHVAQVHDKRMIRLASADPSLEVLRSLVKKVGRMNCRNVWGVAKTLAKHNLDLLTCTMVDRTQQEETMYKNLQRCVMVDRKLMGTSFAQGVTLLTQAK
jgi:hypothetical protein